MGQRPCLCFSLFLNPQCLGHRCSVHICGVNETIEGFLPKVDLSVDSLDEGGWNVFEVMIMFRLLSLAG